MAACVICTTDIREDARFCPSCGAEQPKQGPAPGSDDDPFIGQVVARNFKIEKLLGVGGMGKVYKARQLSLDKAVVIKILHDHFRDDPQLVQRFQREARAASRLNHPNSIQVIDFGQDDNKVLFMAQEFLEGTDLFTVLKNQGPLARDRLARVMVQVCSALAEAHEHNVIHRDLKPENIMVEDRRGQRDFVKVLDFGIAKIQDPDDTGGQALTQAGMVCGTPEYMSPEQARGMALDARSDLYSLGVLAYQLLTGELPFTADSPIGIVTKHILEAPVPPSQRAPNLHIDADIEAVVLRAMGKEAGERYQTAAEMGEAFERLLYGQQAPTGSVAQSSESAASGTLEGAPGAVPAGSTPAPSATPTAPTEVRTPTTGVQPSLSGETPSRLAPQPSVSVPDMTPPRSGGGALKWVGLAAAALLVAGGAAALVVIGGGKEKPAVEQPVAEQPVVGEKAPKPDGDEDTKQAALSEPSDDGPPDEEPPDEEPPEAKRPAKQAQAQHQKKPPKQAKAAVGKRVSPSARAESDRLFAEAQLDAISSDAGKRGDAYKKLKKAYDLNPSNPRPLVNIAFIHKTNGDMAKACSAAKTYVASMGKKLSRAQAHSLAKQNCLPEDLPPGLR